VVLLLEEITLGISQVGFMYWNTKRVSWPQNTGLIKISFLVSELILKSDNKLLFIIMSKRTTDLSTKSDFGTSI
jgi:hypothetical protein